MEVSVNVGGEVARLVVPSDVIVKIHGASVTLTTEEDRGELRLSIRSIWGSGSLRVQQMIDDWYYGSIACTAHVADAAFYERAEAHLGRPVKVQTWGGPEYGVPMHHFAVPLEDQSLSMNEMRRFARGWTGGDVYCEPVTTCTAHVTPDPRAVQQAQTAGQMQAAQNSQAPVNTPKSVILCDGCQNNVQRNNAVWTGAAGGWRCMNCAPAGHASQAQQAQQPASAAQPLGAVDPGQIFVDSSGSKAWQYFHSGAAGDPAPDDSGPCIAPLPGDRVIGSSPDFGAQVSDQLASARGIDRAKESARMRVPTWEEKEAERERMANIFRARGIL